MFRLVAMMTIVVLSLTNAFTIHTIHGYATSQVKLTRSQLLAGEGDDGVVELGDDVELAEKAVAPFLSQGEISQGALNPDLSDPKQARVIIYIILSLLPVLFLIPLILGNRDFIPMDELPPVVM